MKNSKPILHIFLDTNIYLSFYSFTDEGLEALDKLKMLVGEKRLSLYTTEQVKNEFYRNRENRMRDALEKLQDQKPPDKFPIFFYPYEEFRELEDSQKTYHRILTSLYKKVCQDMKNQKLKADETITQLFKNAAYLNLTEEIIIKAEKRVRLGNPPGKKNDLGDAINWELLLKEFSDDRDLYLITNDGDYFSKLKQMDVETRLNRFLEQEYSRQNSHSKIRLYRNLTSFLRECCL